MAATRRGDKTAVKKKNHGREARARGSGSSDPGSIHWNRSPQGRPGCFSQQQRNPESTTARSLGKCIADSAAGSSTVQTYPRDNHAKRSGRTETKDPCDARAFALASKAAMAPASKRPSPRPCARTRARRCHGGAFVRGFAGAPGTQVKKRTRGGARSGRRREQGTFFFSLTGRPRLARAARGQKGGRMQRGEEGGEEEE